MPRAKGNVAGPPPASLEHFQSSQERTPRATRSRVTRTALSKSHEKTAVRQASEKAEEGDELRVDQGRKGKGREKPKPKPKQRGGMLFKPLPPENYEKKSLDDFRESISKDHEAKATKRRRTARKDSDEDPVIPKARSSLEKTRGTLRKPSRPRVNAEAGPSTPPRRRSPRKAGRGGGGGTADSPLTLLDSSQNNHDSQATSVPGFHDGSSPLSSLPSPTAMVLAASATVESDLNLKASTFFTQELERLKAEREAANAVPGPPSPSSSDGDRPDLLGAMGFHAEELDPYSECLDDEERNLVKEHEDETDPCPYCREPLPIPMSTELTDLYTAYRMSATRPRFDQRSLFCNKHRAESHTIPLGLRRGYPEQVPWDRIWRTLELPWIRERIKRFTQEPKTSMMFRDCLAMVEKQRAEGTFRPGSSLREAMVFIAAPGYYGQLGAELIKDYLNELAALGVQPYQSDLYRPLTVEQYREYVLVPESANFLIMHHHLRYDPERDCEIPFDDVYNQAESVRRQSVKYGRVMAERTPAHVVKTPFLREKAVRRAEVLANRGGAEGLLGRKKRKKDPSSRAESTWNVNDDDLIVVEHTPRTRILSDIQGPGNQPIRTTVRNTSTDEAMEQAPIPSITPTLHAPSQTMTRGKKQTPTPTPTPIARSQESFSDIELDAEHAAQLDKIEGTYLVSASQESYWGPPIGSQELEALTQAEAGIHAR